MCLKDFGTSFVGVKFHILKTKQQLHDKTKNQKWVKFTKNVSHICEGKSKHECLKMLKVMYKRLKIMFR